MAAIVPIEQGQTTIPADGDDPDAGAAPRSPSSYVVMVESQALSPTARRNAAGDAIPDSVLRRR